MKGIKLIEGFIKHIEEANNCDCEICIRQENGTYLDGLRQALVFITSKK